MVKLVAPRVHLIAQTNLNSGGMADFIADVGAKDWHTDTTNPAQYLIEVAGRLCYKAFGVDLNPNISRVREGNEKYIGNIISSGHGSVLEHATCTFAVLGITPVFTHELVRHRVGTAYSQVSGRYCRIDELGFFWPGALGEGALLDHLGGAAEARAPISVVARMGDDLLKDMEEFQREFARLLNMDEMKDFNLKKRLTSFQRRFAPYGLETGIIFTANHRMIRHMIGMRTSPHAEVEIALVFNEIASQMEEDFPAIYQDMIYSDEFGYSFTSGRV